MGFNDVRSHVACLREQESRNIFMETLFQGQEQQGGSSDMYSRGLDSRFGGEVALTSEHCFTFKGGVPKRNCNSSEKNKIH